MDYTMILLYCIFKPNLAHEVHIFILLNVLQTNLCLKKLTVHGNEMHLYLAKVLPELWLFMSLTLQLRSRNHN